MELQIVMEKFISHTLEQVSNQGLSMAFTILAVWYLYGKIKECEIDRKALWERLLKIATNENDTP